MRCNANVLQFVREQEAGTTTLYDLDFPYQKTREWLLRTATQGSEARGNTFGEALHANTIGIEMLAFIVYVIRSRKCAPTPSMPSRLPQLIQQNRVLRSRAQTDSMGGERPSTTSYTRRPLPSDSVRQGSMEYGCHLPARLFACGCESST